MTIKEYLKWLTDYRDNLVKFLQRRLDDLTGPTSILEGDYQYLTIAQICKIVNEIELCNRYIDYLHIWDNYYNGPVIPFDNTELIRLVEQYIHKEENQ